MRAAYDGACTVVYVPSNHLKSLSCLQALGSNAMGITRPNAQWATLCLFRGAHILYLYNASQQHTAFHNETFCRIIVSMRFWCKHLHKFEFATFPFVIQQIHSKIRKDVNLFKVNNYMLLYVSVFPDVCCNGMPFLLKRGISMTTLHMLWCFEMILFIATKSYTALL